MRIEFISLPLISFVLFDRCRGISHGVLADGSGDLEGERVAVPGSWDSGAIGGGNAAQTQRKHTASTPQPAAICWVEVAQVPSTALKPLKLSSQFILHSIPQFGLAASVLPTSLTYPKSRSCHKQLPAGALFLFLHNTTILCHSNLHCKFHQLCFLPLNT